MGKTAVTKKRLRLIADDLTGALDTAAQFVASTGPVPIFPRDTLPATLPPSSAIDSGTREADEFFVPFTMTRLAPALAPRADTISYLKLDSLLRGNPAPALAALLGTLPFRCCIIAPAFPFHHRITQGGLQYVLGPDGPKRVGRDLRSALAAAGIGVTLARPGDPLPRGVSLWDAETDADLRRIAAFRHSRDAPILWAGSAGLATALAGSPPPIAPPMLPLLGIFGTNHPVTAAQLRAVAAHHLQVSENPASSVAAIRAHLAAASLLLVSFRLPDDLSPASAATRIARALTQLLPVLPPPATLLVSGGETLAAVCTALGASHLEVFAEAEPGAPVSRMVGGVWDGVQVISKSGAFGAPDFLTRVVAAAAPAC